MRIVLTSNFSPWSRYCGGGQRSTHALACALSARGHEVTVVYTRALGETVAVPERPPYRLAWALLFARKSARNATFRPLSAVSVARRVRALMREEPIDVVHSQGEEGALIPRVVKCTFVATPRFPSYPALLRPELSFVTWMRLALFDSKYLLLRAALREASRVCPTSQSSAASLTRAYGLPSSRMKVVANGVDERFFAARRLPAHETILLFFGRIERSKGVDVLVEAFGKIQDAQAQLVLIGEGEALPALLQRAQELGVASRVHHVRWCSTPLLVEHLQRATVVVLPSREESFGNAMVETLAAGAPLLSTSAGSIPELIRDGVHALLVSPGDVAALRSGIEALLADPARRARMGHAGRAHVRAHFSWGRVAESYERVYRAMSYESSVAEESALLAIRGDVGE